MAKVYVLCGKIASGKTTYANQLKANSKAVILSVDDLMLSLFDGCLGEKHNETVMKIFAYFYSLAEELIANDIDVIFDYGYWTKAERDNIKKYFEEKGINTQLHYIIISENKRIKQLENRNEILSKSTKRVYIIHEELRERLDLLFEEPQKDEIDVLIEY